MKRLNILVGAILLLATPAQATLVKMSVDEMAKTATQVSEHDLRRFEHVGVGVFVHQPTHLHEFAPALSILSSFGRARVPVLAADFDKVAVSYH